LWHHFDYPSIKFQLFFSNQPSIRVDIQKVGNVCSNIIFGDVTLPPPPPSTNHDLYVNLHPFIGETTPQSTIVVGDHVKPSEPKKKKPIKVEWEINQIYQDQWATKFVYVIDN
jgi:hypothetical protein